MSEIEPESRSTSITLPIGWHVPEDLPVPYATNMFTQAGEYEMPQFKAGAADEHLSPEEREAREKGLQLAARIEQLYQADEGFRLWYHKGLDDIEAGRTVTFSENGWSEE